ncbi:MAG: hypothetical protein MJY74_03560 [Bacteroidaceae bacterium]|nr:hypothetical protein [Bacteroidaceae bacterium]
MKKTIIFASVALATLFAFSSCQKETLQDNGSTNGVRIITAEFENNATKTDLNSDGVTPEWKVGDIIRILNATTHQDVTIKSGEDTPTNPGDGIIKNGKIVIAIDDNITGTLYAVYPASATTITSCSGSIDFTIPTVQDGTFGSANICVAKSIADDETNKDNLVFSNATSVLEFSQTAASTQVLRVAVTAANAIAGKLTASFGTDNKATISSTDGLTGKIIYTTAAATAQDKYYVAVAPVETGAITFNYYKAEEEKSESKTTKTLALNKIYALTIPTEDYTNSYVEITMTVGSDTKTYKWAKCNIGATKETDYGDYYAWGTTVKAYSAVTSAFTFVSSNPYGDIYEAGSWTARKGFDWLNTPFTNGVYNSSSNTKVFTKYVPESKKTDYGDGGTFYDDNEVLELDDDVAHKVLGGTWRMPTKEEFDALCKLTKEWKTNYNNSGVNGKLFTDADGNSIFLPVAGYGSNSLFQAGSIGFYWSSSLKTDEPSKAYYSMFSNTNAYTTGGDRCRGQSVRALSE